MRIEEYIVYEMNIDEHNRNFSLPPDMTIRKLKSDELEALNTDTSFEGQGRRFKRLGFNDAYGLFIENRLGHVAWLVPYEHDKASPIRNVKLRPGEAEITHCVTHPELRGRGLYPKMIQGLLTIAGTQGIDRIFMITNVANNSSQRGIEKAGLSKTGHVRSIVFGDRWRFTWRGHRLKLVR